MVEHLQLQAGAPGRCDQEYGAETDKYPNAILFPHLAGHIMKPMAELSFPHHPRVPRMMIDLRNF
jgi:hypothetical protein